MTPLVFASSSDSRQGLGRSITSRGAPTSVFCSALCHFCLPWHDSDIMLNLIKQEVEHTGQNSTIYPRIRPKEISIACPQRLGSIVREEGETGHWASLPGRNSIKVHHPCCVHRWISERLPDTTLGTTMHPLSVCDKGCPVAPQPSL